MGHIFLHDFPRREATCSLGGGIQEFMLKIFALERLRGSGRVVSDRKGVVRVVAALRAKVRLPRGKHIDFERRILRVGGGTPVEWIKAHTSEAQRRNLGLADDDVVGNDRTAVAAKEALPPPSPHLMRWQRWRDHAEKLRLFWGAFGPTLAKHIRQERPPQQPREVDPPVFRARSPQRDWRAPAGRSWN